MLDRQATPVLKLRYDLIYHLALRMTESKYNKLREPHPTTNDYPIVLVTGRADRRGGKIRLSKQNFSSHSTLSQTSPKQACKSPSLEEQQCITQESPADSVDNNRGEEMVHANTLNSMSLIERQRSMNERLWSHRPSTSLFPSRSVSMLNSVSFTEGTYTTVDGGLPLRHCSSSIGLRSGPNTGLASYSAPTYLYSQAQPGWKTKHQDSWLVPSFSFRLVRERIDHSSKQRQRPQTAGNTGSTSFIDSTIAPCTISTEVANEMDTTLEALNPISIVHAPIKARPIRPKPSKRPVTRETSTKYTATGIASTTQMSITSPGGGKRVQTLKPKTNPVSEWAISNPCEGMPLEPPIHLDKTSTFSYLL